MVCVAHAPSPTPHCFLESVYAAQPLPYCCCPPVGILGNAPWYPVVDASSKQYFGRIRLPSCGGLSCPVAPSCPSIFLEAGFRFHFYVAIFFSTLLDTRAQMAPLAAPPLAPVPIDVLEVVSLFSPRNESVDSNDDMLDDNVEVPETDPSLLNSFFLVEGVMLMQLFIVCQLCSAKLSPRRVQLTAIGTTPVVHYYCARCGLRKGGLRRWEGQRRAVEHTYEKTFLGNIMVAVSAVTTVTRFFELQRWAKQLRLALISDSTFWKWFKWCKPAIEKVYHQHQQKVLDVIRSRYEGTEGLHLAADGAFDSRGYSALIGKVAMVDLETGLVLHTEVLHRTETSTLITDSLVHLVILIQSYPDGSSSQMEVEGLRRLLRWLSADGWSIASITTDRNRSFPALLDEMEEEIGKVQHFWDGWHLVKWFGNNLRKEETTGPFTRCGHSAIDGPRPDIVREGTPAFERLRRLVLNKVLQRDLPKASPRGGSSICESKNALDRLYCRKEIFYPLFTYKLYEMLSTMHFNTLRLAELAGERRVERVVEVQRKYFTRTSRVAFKTPVEHIWQDQITQAILDARRKHHEEPLADDVDIQEMIEAEAAFYEGIPEPNLESEIDSDEEEYEEEL
ncbi:hypothetical protein ANCCAN_19668 [Ancylostoma caninum]|uniref:Mutator-like transposase domain-containing protein n=1 Tax=Ancylostoma caninum TaxID=29170 RepID=A0A368FQJ9_ANCCA|nr:hypothetical protein ANCCAN_19668 [Ancylostoma caninum]